MCDAELGHIAFGLTACILLHLNWTELFVVYVLFSGCVM